MNKESVMNENTDSYHYTDSGLDNVILRNGFNWVETPFGDAVSIENMRGLHECIAHCLVNKPDALSGKEFRYLRSELDLSQETIGLIVGRGERRVRGWETEDKSVPEPANTMIRFIYRERTNPSTTYEQFSLAVAELQKADKALFEIRLQATDLGWETDDCKVA